MSKKESLYMFAIVPPAALEAQIHNERVIFAEKYNCVKALKPPIHITLFPPFEERPAFENRVAGLASWVAQIAPFKIKLQGFNFFIRESPVAYIDVVPNDALQRLRSGFVEELTKYTQVKEFPGPYNPHFTIGYRDIPPDVFPQIVAEYSAKAFDGEFDVNSIYLWKHDRTSWRAVAEYKFLHGG